MDTKLDIMRDKFFLAKEQEDINKYEMCGKCDEHNENCPFYDSKQETWDYRSCFEERGWE